MRRDQRFLFSHVLNPYLNFFFFCLMLEWFNKQPSESSFYPTICDKMLTCDGYRKHCGQRCNILENAKYYSYIYTF